MQYLRMGSFLGTQFRATNEQIEKVVFSTFKNNSSRTFLKTKKFTGLQLFYFSYIKTVGNRKLKKWWFNNWQWISLRSRFWRPNRSSLMCQKQRACTTKGTPVWVRFSFKFTSFAFRQAVNSILLLITWPWKATISLSKVEDWLNDWMIYG